VEKKVRGRVRHHVKQNHWLFLRLGGGLRIKTLERDPSRQTEKRVKGAWHDTLTLKIGSSTQNRREEIKNKKKV